MGMPVKPLEGWMIRKGGTKEKSGGKTAAEFGWDTSKLQKITLFQAQDAPLQRTTVRSHICIGCASFWHHLKIAEFGRLLIEKTLIRQLLQN
jgi:hypothetical protein